jgi:antibiotic biosynthesis monooxygenase (ABM) superfamily enzyme
MTKRNRDLAQRATGDSTAMSGQLTSPQVPAAAKWKMAIATFVGAYIVTAIAIPRELSVLPHSWSFYEINVITNIIMATAMTWAILPGMSRLLRRWLYPVAARRPGRADLATTRRPGMITVHVAGAAAQTACRNK